MNLALLISMPFVYIVAELIISYFFNRKIEMIGKKDFNRAAAFGATSTFLFLVSIFLGFLIGAYGGLTEPWIYIYPIFIAGGMTIGNYLATIIQGYVVKREDEGRPIKFLTLSKKVNQEVEPV